MSESYRENSSRDFLFRARGSPVLNFSRENKETGVRKSAKYPNGVVCFPMGITTVSAVQPGIFF
jgi:hypothetical protein